MVEERIRVGDAVMLKSGGAVMTVQALSMSLAYCAWTAGGQAHHGTFEVASLDLVEHARPAGAALVRTGKPSPHAR